MPGNGNAGNLKPNSQRTPEELKRMGAKGGKASGEARKRKKATRDLARQVLALTPKTSRKQQKAILEMGYDAEAEGLPCVELIMQMQIASQAMEGDLASAAFLYSFAQVPDMKAALERERIRAAKRTDETSAAALKQAREILGEIESVIE